MFAAENLDSLEYHLVEQRLLEEPTWGPHESFRTTIERVRPSKPGAYLLTACSAVPLADTIRGYYDALGEATPQLHYIHANTTTSRDSGLRERTISSEVSRLRSIRGMASVCVIDQWRATGKSLDMGRDIAKRLEINGIHLISGLWYQNADAVDVDLQQMTSIHKELMYFIGQRAAPKRIGLYQ